MSNYYPEGLTIEEGVEKILAVTGKLDTEIISVTEAHNRVLAEDVTAAENMPPFAKSPYDGYAFRAEDIENADREHPVTLQVIEEVPAGHYPTKTVGPGQATKILTGAPLPEGADTIEKFEVTEVGEGSVTFFEPVKQGSNVIPAGDNMKKGEVILEKGTKITASGCGLLAELGMAQVQVYKKVRVSLISTGDELLEVGEPMEPAKIRNSSVYTLNAYLESWGMKPRMCGIVRDRAELIADAVKHEQPKSDVIITTGGVSVGDYDCLQDAMELIGAEILYWKLKMKPGMAFLASRYRGTLILSLSGNPAAALMELLMVARPVLGTLAGEKDVMGKPFTVKLKNAFPKKSKVRRFIPGRLEIIDGTAYIDVPERQGNGMLKPLEGCDILGEIPSGSPALEAGDSIQAYRLYRLF